ncbi:MAG: hypothetical protein K5769_00475 [Pseudobutyrivibrio sp.]|nr:hypothetical protein [Pseudobutyrivibrio sp.]
MPGETSKKMNMPMDESGNSKEKDGLNEQIKNLDLIIKKIQLEYNNQLKTLQSKQDQDEEFFKYLKSLSDLITDHEKTKQKYIEQLKNPKNNVSNEEIEEIGLDELISWYEYLPMNKQDEIENVSSNESPDARSENSVDNSGKKLKGKAPAESDDETNNFSSTESYQSSHHYTNQYVNTQQDYQNSTNFSDQHTIYYKNAQAEVENERPLILEPNEIRAYIKKIENEIKNLREQHSGVLHRINQIKYDYNKSNNTQEKNDLFNILSSLDKKANKLFYQYKQLNETKDTVVEQLNFITGVDEDIAQINEFIDRLYNWRTTNINDINQQIYHIGETHKTNAIMIAFLGKEIKEHKAELDKLYDYNAGNEFIDNLNAKISSHKEEIIIWKSIQKKYKDVQEKIISIYNELVSTRNRLKNQLNNTKTIINEDNIAPRTPQRTVSMFRYLPVQKGSYHWTDSRLQHTNSMLSKQNVLNSFSSYSNQWSYQQNGCPQTMMNPNFKQMHQNSQAMMNPSSKQMHQNPRFW